VAAAYDIALIVGCLVEKFPPRNLPPRTFILYPPARAAAPLRPSRRQCPPLPPPLSTCSVSHRVAEHEALVQHPPRGRNRSRDPPEPDGTPFPPSARRRPRIPVASVLAEPSANMIEVSGVGSFESRVLHRLFCGRTGSSRTVAVSGDEGSCDRAGGQENDDGAQMAQVRRLEEKLPGRSMWPRRRQSRLDTAPALAGLSPSGRHGLWCSLRLGLASAWPCHVPPAPSAPSNDLISLPSPPNLAAPSPRPFSFLFLFSPPFGRVESLLASFPRLLPAPFVGALLLWFLLCYWTVSVIVLRHFFGRSTTSTHCSTAPPFLTSLLPRPLDHRPY
jgi:hypothetical protein